MRTQPAPIQILVRHILRRHTLTHITGHAPRVAQKYIQEGTQQKTMEMAHGVPGLVLVAARTHTLEEVALQVDDVYVAQLNPHSDIPTAPE